MFDTLRPYIDVLLSVGFIPLLLVVYTLSLYFFWYESKQVGKDRNSIFDHWFIVTIVMVGWGRLAFIISSYRDFLLDSYWFLIPYERYGDEFFIFRALPWKLLRIWDGGFLFIPMYFSFIFVSVIYVLFFKRWRWKEMMLGVYSSAHFLLSVTLIVYGLFLEKSSIIVNGCIVLFLTLLITVVLRILKRVYQENVFAFVRLGQILIALYVAVSILFLSRAFLIEDILLVDRLHAYGALLLTVVMLIYYFVDIRRGDSETNFNNQLSVKQNVTLNQAIKVTDGQ